MQLVSRVNAHFSHSVQLEGNYQEEKTPKNKAQGIHFNFEKISKAYLVHNWKLSIILAQSDFMAMDSVISGLL